LGTWGKRRITIRSFFLALQFLTIITIVPDLIGTRRELSSSLAFFPFTGLILGSLLAGFDWAARGLWSPEICGVLDTVWLALLTRGLHLDGVADTFDAVGSGADRERALEIMRDSSNGALGMLAMVCLLMVKAAALVGLSTHSSWQWFMLIPCLSRLGINIMGAVSQYARSTGGLGEAFTGKASRKYLPVALATALTAAWILRGTAGLTMLAAGMAWCVPAAMWCRHRFGGITGDLLGAHVETVETAMFLAAAAIVA